MTDHLNRTKKFSNAEFSRLQRNTDGDIVELSTCFFWLTGSQHDKLSEDDWSRYEEYQEDLRCLMDEARAEFG